MQKKDKKQGTPSTWTEKSFLEMLAAGTDKVLTLDDVHITDAIPSGYLPLDIALGTYGFACNHTHLIWGKKGVGKTTLALNLVREAQMLGKKIFWVETEGKISAELADVNGVNPAGVVFYRPTSIEDAANKIIAAIKSKAFGLVVLDSLGAGSPVSRETKVAGDYTMADRARVWTFLTSLLNYHVSVSGTCLLLIDQVRDQVNTMPGMPMGKKKTAPNATEHGFSTIIKLDRIKSIVENTQTVGQETMATITDNCLGVPGRRVKFEILYKDNIGIDRVGGIIDIALQAGVILKAGAWIYALYLHEDFGEADTSEIKADSPKFQGRDSFRDFLTQNPSQYNLLMSIAKSNYTGVNAPAVDEDEEISDIILVGEEIEDETNQ